MPFRTDFPIHLEPVEEGRTRIEVIEYEPEVTVGANFHLCGRHLFPAVTPEARSVAPTTRDRREMLDRAVRLAGVHSAGHAIFFRKTEPPVPPD